MIKNLRVSGKLISINVVSLMGIVLIAVAAIHIMGRINDGVERIYADRVIPLKQLNAISSSYGVAVIDAVNKANAGLLSAEQAAASIEEAHRRIEQNWQAYRATQLTAEEGRLAQEAKALFEVADQAIQEVHDALAGMSGNVEGQLARFDGPLYARIDPISDKIAELIDLQLRVAAEERTQIAGLYSQSTTFFSVGVLVIIGIMVLIGRFVYASIAGPLGQLSRRMREIEQNHDLSLQAEIDTRDEIGEMAAAFNSMVRQFRKVIGQLLGAVSQLSAAAEQMSAISHQTSQQMQRQHAETEHVATAMNEMSATIQEVSRSATTAETVAQNTRDEAEKGDQILSDTARAIKELGAEVEHAATVIQRLDQDSESITVVLDVIKGIAEQTNLLALNAAIEAARAGEQGRGFAVVADEVRSLAQKTQDSTSEIEEQISRLQEGAKQAVGAMRQGQRKAQQSVEHADVTSQALHAVTQHIIEISDMNTQIASAVEEQSAVAEEMNGSLTAISEVSRESEEGARQAAAASEELSRLASELRAMVQQFKV